MEIDLKVRSVDDARTAIEMLTAYISMQSTTVKLDENIDDESIDVLLDHGMKNRSRNCLTANNMLEAVARYRPPYHQATDATKCPPGRHR